MGSLTKIVEAMHDPSPKAARRPRASAGKAVQARKRRRAKAPWGSKIKLITGLLTRKGGCTRAEVLAVTGWPSVSMPQQADAAGLKLKVTRVAGVNHYSAA